MVKWLVAVALGVALLWPQIADAQGFSASRRYHIRLKNSGDPGLCLNGNKLDASGNLAGAAFTDSCDLFIKPENWGQMWQIVDIGGGYYRLKTKAMRNANKCLEGNKMAPTSTFKGAAFMDTCQNVTGQMWKFVPANDGVHFTLRSKFLEAENLCLGRRGNGTLTMYQCYGPAQQWLVVLMQH